jgi:exodeoxyribonuclease III
MQIATWNVNSLKVRLPQVIDWLKTTNCDVLTLQELKQDNDNFPKSSFDEIGYNYVFNGQKTYNGVAIISKHPISDVVYDIPGFDDIQKRVIAATINDVRVICVYVVNGENLDSDKYQYKLKWLAALEKYVKDSLDKYPKLALLGDFNIAPEDRDIYDPIGWKDQVLCSVPERDAFNQLINLGLTDSFRIFNQEDKQYTWWDYRNFAFRRKLGLRIDHILISDSLKQITTNCLIDTNPRKNERPSDHTPVFITFNE